MKWFVFKPFHMDIIQRNINFNSGEENLEEEKNVVSSYDFYNSFLKSVLNKDFLSNLINVSLYQTDFSSVSGNHNISGILKDFLTGIRKDLYNSEGLNVPHNQLKNIINLAVSILELKEDVSTRYINYDTILKIHFPTLDGPTQMIIKNVQQNRIKDAEEFKTKLDELLLNVRIYKTYEKGVHPTLKKIGAFHASIEQGEMDPTMCNKLYRDIIYEAHGALSELPVLNDNEKRSDFMIFDDDESIPVIAKETNDFLSKTFRRYKTGYDVIDDASGGIESGSVSIISGPSNHAKSIFMINIIKNVIEQNDWKENDAVLFVTLEDDKFKLTARLISIFGNNHAGQVKDVYERVSNMMNENPELASATEGFIGNLVKHSIISTTKDNCKLIIAESKENSYSMADINRQIDTFRERDGINVRFVAIDYIDVMNASYSKYTSTSDDYNLHGDIVSNMRDCAKSRGIPILTITQSQRGAEDAQIQTNNSIGGSIKKVRYSDLVIMIKQCSEVDFLGEQVGKDIGLQKASGLSNADELNKFGIPFEVTITKNKYGDRNMTKYHIFSKLNLKIYQDIVLYAKDMKESKKKFKETANALENLEFSNSNSNFESGSNYDII